MNGESVTSSLNKAEPQQEPGCGLCKKCSMLQKDAHLRNAKGEIVAWELSNDTEKVTALKSSTNTISPSFSLWQWRQNTN